MTWSFSAKSLFLLQINFIPRLGCRGSLWPLSGSHTIWPYISLFFSAPFRSHFPFFFLVLVPTVPDEKPLDWLVKLILSSIQPGKLPSLYILWPSALLFLQEYWLIYESQIYTKLSILPHNTVDFYLRPYEKKSKESKRCCFLFILLLRQFLTSPFLN